MGPWLPLTNPGSKPSWKWLCVIAAALLVLAGAGGGIVVGLMVSYRYPPLQGSWAQGRDDYYDDEDSSRRASGPQQQQQEEGATARSFAAAAAAAAVSSGLDGPHKMQEQRRVHVSVDEATGGGLLKPYTSFAKYALESSKSAEPLPLPLVVPIGGRSSVSIPLITIIGVQKGGTTNLRRNLLTHPLVSGMPNEVHFFDRNPDIYPKLGYWPGDGRERELGPGAVGRILSEYAIACLENGKPSNKPIRDQQVAAMSRGVIVESSPRYILSPIAPYRMKMVRPHAKFVVVLRDPTDRYFSQLRMTMCKRQRNQDYPSLEEQISTHFHLPGQAEGYLQRGAEAYEPYGALCRGENATSVDLWDCYRSMKAYNPLHRGLYADQLERWFRVYDRSQILVVDSSEMFADFTATVARVAEWAGLPEHEFEYERHEFSGTCGESGHGHRPDFFVDGGRYETMLAEEELFREWYRPHTERLEKLIGRKMMW